MNRATKHFSRRRSLGVVLALMLIFTTVVPAAQAQTRLIVRDSLGLNGLNLTCLLLGCQVQYGLGDPQGQLFLVTLPSVLNPVTSILRLNLQLGIVGVELDQPVHTMGASAGVAPSYLTDKTPVSYYGSTVWNGYISQPAAQLIRNDATHNTLLATGNGVTVAVIDTGVDTTHPVLAGVLVSGYDFTRNQSGGSETTDVNTRPSSSGSQAGQVNQSTVALLDQSTVALLDGNGSYSAFGHGTMTAGLVHLVAPQAKIMPLKAFGANGTGYASDVLRAIYYGVNHHANVLSMSFSFSSSSNELSKAINYANTLGVISVASAGNDGQNVKTYPGALPGVIDVASTDNYDVQSSFTNYGSMITLAAPGEGIMTTYPWGSYAAGWGTSFSAPLVSGAAAVMLGRNGFCIPLDTRNSMLHGVWISNPNLDNLRLDAYAATQACR